MRGMRTLALALILAGTAVAPVVAKAADLTITVKDVHSQAGFVMIALYDNEGAFLDIAKAKAMDKRPAADAVSFIFHDLPAGRYAASAYHDENANGKMDKNWVGIPKEGYGFTNDAQGTMGPPKFGQASFAFDGKTATTVAFSLNY